MACCECIEPVETGLLSKRWFHRVQEVTKNAMVIIILFDLFLLVKKFMVLRLKSFSKVEKINNLSLLFWLLTHWHFSYYGCAMWFFYQTERNQ